MERCSFCRVEKNEDDFHMYSIHNMTRGRIQKGFVCKPCSDSHYGDKWYPITGYDQICEISNYGNVRELKDGKFFNITTVQNASVRYVYLYKNGKAMKKNTSSLTKRFIYNKK
jgi:hypothetical protein